MEDFISGMFSGAWGLKLILIICIAKTLLDIIGAIAFFIYCNEKFRQPPSINDGNELTSVHKNFIVSN